MVMDVLISAAGLLLTGFAGGYIVRSSVEDARRRRIRQAAMRRHPSMRPRHLLPEGVIDYLEPPPMPEWLKTYIKEVT